MSYWKWWFNRRKKTFKEFIKYGIVFLVTYPIFYLLFGFAKGFFGLPYTPSASCYAKHVVAILVYIFLIAIGITTTDIIKDSYEEYKSECDGKDGNQKT